MDPKRQAATPPVKVVGFHVEGASPSPRPSTLSDAAGREVSTSPSPVIIPPLFQGQRDAGPTSPSRTSSAAPGTVPGLILDEEDAGGLPPIRTSSLALEDSSGRLVRSPVKSPQTIPLSPVLAPQQQPGEQSDTSSAATGTPGPSPRVLPPAAAASGPASSAAGAVVSPFTGAPNLEGGASAATPAAAQPKQPPAQQQAPQPPQQPAQQAAAQQAGSVGQQAAQQGQQPQQGAQQQKPQKALRVVEPPPKKELTKAERRAIQEAQRAAKAAAKAEKELGAAAPKLTKQGSTGNLAKQQAGTSTGAGKAQAAPGGAAAEARQSATGEAQAGGRGGGRQGAGASKGGKGEAAEAHVTKSTELFAHLPPYRKVTLETIMEKAEVAGVPLEVVKLGLQYVDGEIRGANARCASMLAMLMHVIQEFKAPPGRSEIAKELLGVINGIVSFLVSCRPLSITMGNAIKFVKCELERLKLQPALTEQQVKDEMSERISSYLQEKIRAADNLIVEHAIAKIQDGDVILTYSHSTLVASVLLKAHKEGRRFSVVVADARPQLEGRRLLHQLLGGGISCEYIYLNALSFMLDKVTKVLLGAGAVLSNGTVLSRVGSAAVAMAAAAERIPVLVAAETYKFHERVQLDSITQNELGDPEEVARLPEWLGDSPLAAWQDIDQLGLLNLRYDAMPADFVSVVVTEAGLIPPTSVAVILRESRQDVMV